MRYPKFLPVNGTIGFVAPSFGCSIEPYHTAFLNAQKKFTGLGHRLELGPNCYASEGIGISSTPEACGAELTEYYCSDKNDILISCGGGELMRELYAELGLREVVEMLRLDSSETVTPETDAEPWLQAFVAALKA